MDAQPQCKTDTIGLRCGFFEVKNMVYFLIAFAVCIVLFIGAFVLNAVMFRPFRTKTPVQESDGHIVYFTSGRNRLTGLVLNEEGTKGLIILAHGMGTDIRYHLPELHYFAEQGYKVFAFEYSGYRGSTGHFFGFSQAALDVKGAIDFMDDGTLPVILAGHSMGAYAVCAALQCTSHSVRKVIAYAPFHSSREAIAEYAKGFVKRGKLLSGIIMGMQWVIFGKNANLSAAEGLIRSGTPALILQGSEDEEVPCDGCSLYAHREELSHANAVFRLIRDPESNRHMTVVRKSRTYEVNRDTMAFVDDFLKLIPCSP